MREKLNIFRKTPEQIKAEQEKKESEAKIKREDRESQAKTKQQEEEAKRKRKEEEKERKKLENQRKKDKEKRQAEMKEIEKLMKEAKGLTEEVAKKKEKKKQAEMKKAKGIIETIAKEEREELPWGHGMIKGKFSLKEALFGKGKPPELGKKPVPETSAAEEAPIVPKKEAVSRWSIIREQEKRRKPD